MQKTDELKFLVIDISNLSIINRIIITEQNIVTIFAAAVVVGLLSIVSKLKWDLVFFEMVHSLANIIIYKCTFSIRFFCLMAAHHHHLTLYVFY